MANFDVTQSRQSGTLNTRTGSRVIAPHTPEPAIFYCTGTGEMLLVPPGDMTYIENEVRLQDKLIRDSLEANRALQAAQDAAHGGIMNQLHKTDEEVVQALKKAYDDAMAARKALYDNVKPLTKLDTTYNKGMVELIPIVGQPELRTMRGEGWHGPEKDRTPSGMRGRKLVYVRQDKMKGSWQRVPLDDGDTKSAHKGFIKKDDYGREKIDTKELKTQLTKFLRKYKTEWIKVEDTLIQGIVTDWAEAWNKRLTYDFAKQNPDNELSQNVDISASAQLMRYLAGAGLTTEWDPLKGDVALRGSARAEFAVAEAKAATSLYLPDKIGFVWCFEDKDGRVYASSAVRFKAELALSGSAGASAVLETSISVGYIPKTAEKDADPKPDYFKIRGVPEDATKAARKFAILNSTETGARAEADVFVGVKAEVKLIGSLQWLDPEDMQSDYQDFAKVGPTVGASAGAGIGGELVLTIDRGRVIFIVDAKACLGLGGKGKFELEVDALLIAKFLKWFFYQLYHADFGRLRFITDKDFMTLSRLMVLMLGGAIKGAEQLMEFIAKSPIALEKALADALRSENFRVKVMDEILAAPERLLHYTPEAKGIALHTLLDTGAFDYLDPRNSLGFDHYKRRRLAIQYILEFSHTRRDFENIIQHMNETGARGDFDANMRKITKFLSDTPEGYVVADISIQLLDCEYIKHAPTKYYPVCRNTSIQYAIQKNGITIHPKITEIQNMPFGSAI